jgi:U3 small nucleolar RNA-associated protein 11
LKKQKLALLSQKARDKNEDEFAFGMLSADKGRAGKHGRGDTLKNRLSHDAVKLLKTQDLGYLRVVAGKGRREISKLEEEVGMTEPQERVKKVLFVDENNGLKKLKRTASKREKRDDTVAEKAKYQDKDNDSDLAESLPAMDTADDIEPSTAKSAAPKTKKSLAAQRDALQDLRAARKRRKRLAELRVAKLDALKKRQREIMAATDELELQRAKMARTVGGVNKDGIKWKIRERKK